MPKMLQIFVIQLSRTLVQQTGCDLLGSDTECP